MPLWVDKHRPHTLDKLVVNTDIGANLRNLVRVACAQRARSSARRWRRRLRTSAAAFQARALT
jgi:hypothetical protein